MQQVFIEHLCVRAILEAVDKVAYKTALLRDAYLVVGETDEQNKRVANVAD